MGKATIGEIAGIRASRRRQRAARAQKKAPGRSLQSFLPLRPAEIVLRDACVNNEVAIVGLACPNAKTAINEIRAEFVRFLALGGDEHLSLDNRVISINGAYIDGTLDLHAQKIRPPLSFKQCKFADEIYAYAAEVTMISLKGSEICGFNGDGMVVTHDLFLNENFVCIGEVWLGGARIGGNLELNDSSLENSGGFALYAQSMIVEQGLIFKNVKSVSGDIIFVAAHVATLNDDVRSWMLADNIVLDGFIYDRIDSKDISASTRIDWLRSQDPGKVGEVFWPQPWEHLVKVLREMGHVEDAKRVAIGKQHALRAAGLIGQRPVQEIGGWRGWRNLALNGVHRAFHWIYGILAGFGYRPLKTVGWMILLWFACGIAYQVAAQRGLIGVANSGIYANESFDLCGDAEQLGRERWTHCGAIPPEYTPFDPFIYSLDVILPLLDLRQETEWRPVVHSEDGAELPFGHALRFLMWFEILFGWITSLLLVSVLGKLVQKD